MNTSAKPNLTFWQIWNMSFGFLGIQFGWGLQMANMSPIYTYLGAKESELPYLWLAGPITGLFVQPVIGALSDRTWTRLGRRRPFFLVGAIIASVCLLLMPHSSTVWMAAGLLWILDAAINVTMEPFRAFVGDKLPEKQRTTGFVMQSFFIGIGQTLANLLPWILTTAGVVGIMASGIPYSTLIAFSVGAIFFLVAVLWTVFTSNEYPPEDMEAFKAQHSQSLVQAIFGEVYDAIISMPRTMIQLAVVQFFTWFAFPCMWQFYGLTVAKHVYMATDPESEIFKQGTEWGGICFAVYNVVCFAIAFVLPYMNTVMSRKAIHAVCLSAGGLGLISTMLANENDFYLLWLGMLGVGIAWASILSMPYVILAGAIKPERMGVYMGVFNLFIVLPQVVMTLVVPMIYERYLGSDPRNVVVFGGVMLLVAAASLVIVNDVGAKNISAEPKAH